VTASLKNCAGVAVLLTLLFSTWSTMPIVLLLLGVVVLLGRGMWSGWAKRRSARHQSLLRESEIRADEDDLYDSLLQRNQPLYRRMVAKSNRKGGNRPWSS